MASNNGAEFKITVSLSEAKAAWAKQRQAARAFAQYLDQESKKSANKQQQEAKLQDRQLKHAERQKQQSAKKDEQQIQRRSKLQINSLKLEERQHAATARAKQQADRKNEQALKAKARLQINSLKLEERQRKQAERDQAKLDRQNAPTGPTLARRAAGVAGNIAGSLFNMITSAITGGYQKYLEVGAGKGPLIGLASGGNLQRSLSGAHGARLGFNMAETQALVPGMARATGAIDPREMMQGMRSTGLGADELGGYYGAIRQGGTLFGTPEVGKNGRPTGDTIGPASGQSKGGEQFQKWIALGMESGIERARLPEFFTGVQGLLQKQLAVATGNVGGTGYASVLAMLGSSGKSGLQGERGAAVLNKLDQGIRTPGGGEAGVAFMNQAMGFGKPGGTTGYYAAEKAREGGIGSMSGENLMKVMGEVKSQFGGGQEGAMALKTLTGTSLQQGEDLLKIYDSNKSVDEKMKLLAKTAEGSKSLEQQANEHMETIGGTLKRIASRYDESAAIGASMAQDIEALEDLEVAFVKKIIPLIEKLVNYADATFFGGGDAGRGEQQKRLDDSHRILFGAESGKDPAAQLKEMVESNKKLAEATIAVEDRNTAVRASGIYARGKLTPGGKAVTTEDARAQAQSEERAAAEKRWAAAKDEIVLRGIAEDVKRHPEHNQAQRNAAGQDYYNTAAAYVKANPPVGSEKDKLTTYDAATGTADVRERLANDPSLAAGANHIKVTVENGSIQNIRVQGAGQVQSSRGDSP